MVPVPALVPVLVVVPAPYLDHKKQFKKYVVRKLVFLMIIDATFLPRNLLDERN
jgi:hypothetical protein